MPIKPEEYPELLKFVFVDLDKIEDVKSFKEKFNDEFSKSSTVGHIIGTATTKFKNNLKTVGIELDKKEVDGKPFEEIVETGLKRFIDFTKKAHDEALAAEKAKIGEPDKVVKELTETLNKTKTELETKLNEQIKLKTDVVQQFDQFKNQIATEKKQEKVKSFVNGAWDKFKWSSTVAGNDLIKKGFIASVNEKYKIALDDKDEPFVTNEKGEKIPSTKKSGEHASFDEVLETEGIAAKVYNVSGKDDKPAPVSSPAPFKAAPAGNGNEPYVHPSALRATNKNPILQEEST